MCLVLSVSVLYFKSDKDQEEDDHQEMFDSADVGPGLVCSGSLILTDWTAETTMKTIPAGFNGPTRTDPPGDWSLQTSDVVK